MRFYSISNPEMTTDFASALLSSLAPDGGLYMPQSLPVVSDTVRAELTGKPLSDVAAYLMGELTGDFLTESERLELCRDAYNFPAPLRTFAGEALTPAAPPSSNEFVFELIHGPTLAFKDFAARFMGRCASRALQRNGESRTILVATSGDTGGAIGHAFLNQPGTKVFILYPKGGVSKVQEQQLTTMGADSNVRAIEVAGTFDDCQSLVKQAFADQDMNRDFNLMSANSINVGRVMPQSFYYFWASLQLHAAFPDRPHVFSIPSGNLGNVTGALMAKLMGAPIHRLIVGHNANDPFVDYLNDGEYRPRSSVATLSNAMDIGRPNNFPRILHLLGNDWNKVRDNIWGASFSDEVTARHLKEVYDKTGYVMCPHTSVGHLAADAYARAVEDDSLRVTVATAHPAKFRSDVERILGHEIEMPASLAKAMKAEKQAVLIGPDLSELNTILENNV